MVDALSKKRAREPNWSKEEELLMMEEVQKRSTALFASFSGPSGSNRSKLSKKTAWEEIRSILNARTSIQRSAEQIEKKYKNLKSKAKKVVHETKYPKTGGGPTPQIDKATEAMICSLEGTPSLEGIAGGLDTADPKFHDVLLEAAFEQPDVTAISNHEQPDLTAVSTDLASAPTDGVLSPTDQMVDCLGTNWSVVDLVPSTVHKQNKPYKKRNLNQEILQLEKEKICQEIKLLDSKQKLTDLQIELVKLQVLQLNPNFFKQ